MKIDGPPRPAEKVECPYLPNRDFIQSYFFGFEATVKETGFLLRTGWRHFGAFFFRPECEGCKACESLRIPVQQLKLTDSQKRIIKKNENTELNVVPMKYNEEYYSVYENHSRVRFGRTVDEKEFRLSFFEPSVPSFLTEYRIDGRLAGLGFCDQGDDGLSSVYFVFHEDFNQYSLGIYSVLKECFLTAEKGLKYYYLGYYIEGNPVMKYKKSFHPCEILNGETQMWEG